MTIDTKLIDQLLTNYKKPEDIIGENGLLRELCDRRRTSDVHRRSDAISFVASACAPYGTLSSSAISRTVRHIDGEPKLIVNCGCSTAAPCFSCSRP